MPYTKFKVLVFPFSYHISLAQNSCFTDFQFFWFIYGFPGNIDYFEKYIIPNFNSFLIIDVIFTSAVKTLIENVSMVQEKITVWRKQPNSKFSVKPHSEVNTNGWLCNIPVIFRAPSLFFIKC